MEDNKKKKQITIAVIGALILIIAIIGSAYAVFTATLTGVKENKLTTGYVTMSCTETNFTFENTSVLTDEQGIARNDNEATCTLVTTMNGTMNIGYDVALYDVTNSAALSENNVKIQASKVDNSTTSYLAGSSATTGVLVSSIKTSAGQYDTSITGYKLDSATVNTTKTIEYKVKAWVANETGNSTTTTNTDGYCSNQTYTTKETCESAGEIWGYDQKIGQAGGTFSFKLKVGASQVLS